jgi:hypothetical protein
LVASHNAFPAILLEPDRIEALLASGDIAVRGDSQRFSALSSLLGAGGSMVDIRARRTVARDGSKRSRES